MSAAPGTAPGTGTGTAPAPVHVTDRCAGCGACLLTCPAHAIRPSGGRLLVLADRCTGCGECVEVCPVDAVAETPAPPSPHTPEGGIR